MVKNVKHLMGFLWVIISIVMLQTCSALPFQQWSVKVVNSMKHGGPLYLRCQSADNDLGVHNLRPGQNFFWKFRENISSTTMFWCYMRSKYGFIAREVFWTNNFYSWISYRCGRNKDCVWSVRDDGTYLQDDADNGTFMHMDEWNELPSSHHE